MSPTSSPNYGLPVFGGCPEEYSESAVYEGGDKVSHNGLVYKCRVYPYSAWCSHDSYAPSAENGKDAWEVLGTCQGSMSPTGSPVFDVLVDVDGCPEKYVEGKGYEASDRVTLFLEAGRGIVYGCADQWRKSSSFPLGFFCCLYYVNRLEHGALCLGGTPLLGSNQYGQMLYLQMRPCQILYLQMPSSLES